MKHTSDYKAVWIPMRIVNYTQPCAGTRYGEAGADPGPSETAEQAGSGITSCSNDYCPGSMGYIPAHAEIILL